VIGLFAGKVYSWMTGMLLATAAISFVAGRMGLHNWFIQHPIHFFSLLFFEVLLIGWYASFRENFSFQKGLGLVCVYTVLNGLTLSVVFEKYHISTLALAFISSAGIFGMATFYGFVGRSLAKFSEWILMGLVALLFALVINLFLGSQLFDYILSCVAVVIFTILAAADTQMIRIKALTSPTNLDALDCALEIYLDFINIFLHVLRLFGIKTKND
jgi:FtsH-binding integral membrane protein